MSLVVPTQNDAAPHKSYVKCCDLKLYSNLRQHFSTALNGRIKCNSCSYAFKCCCTSLRWHMQKEHPTIEVVTDHHEPDASNDTFPFSPTQHKPSDVWKHFTKTKNDLAECDVCNSVLSISGDHSNLWKHLRVLHAVYLHRVNQFLSSSQQEAEKDGDNDVNNFTDECYADADVVEENTSACNTNSERLQSDLDENSYQVPFVADGSDVENYEIEMVWDTEESADILAKAVAISDVAFSANDCPVSPNVTETADMDPPDTFKTDNKRSNVWTYFKRTKLSAVECLKCHTSLKYNTALGTTTNLWKHMELKHHLNSKELKMTRTHKSRASVIAELKQKALDSENPALKIRKPTRVPSTVWLHFIRHSSALAECSLCKAKFKLSYGTTSNLRKHMIAKHPGILGSKLPKHDAVG